MCFAGIFTNEWHSLPSFILLLNSTHAKSLLLNPKMIFEYLLYPSFSPPAMYPTNTFSLDDTADASVIATGKFANGCQNVCPNVHFSVELTISS